MLKVPLEMLVTQNVMILVISVNLCFDTSCLGYNIPFSNVSLNRTRRQTDTDFRDGSCASLNIVNGEYNVPGRTDHIKGTPIPNFSIVNITCKAGYGLYPSDPINTCINGVWKDLPLQECRQLCEPRISTSVNVTCTLYGRNIDCTKPVVEGTEAQSSCNRFYQSNSDDFPISKCSGGYWNEPLIRCEPECGQLIPSGGTYVVGGYDTIKGEFPWHIGLYRFNSKKSTYNYKCGGSIIRPSLVITAAHCVTSYLNERFEAREFYVAAGKYYSDYDATDDSPGLVQKRQVISYEIPREYRAYHLSYEADMALLIVEKPFTLSNVVLPVCVDWNNNFDKEQLKPNQTGTVVGWGYTDPGKSKVSDTLKQLTASYVDRPDCLDKVPLEFQRWVTTDKFCAGWTNGSSACKGDSGGGLVFKRADNGGNKIKFYIRGLVSVGPLNNSQCDNYKYGVYTKISAHMKWITKVVSSEINLQQRNTDNDGSCASLNIANGEYNVLGRTDHIKGTPIPNHSIVNITCKAGYGLYPSDPINNCINGVWKDLPLQECRHLLCEPRISTSVKVTCTLHGRDIDCTKPVVEGTVAQSRCNHFYYRTHNDFPRSKCSEGSWDNPLIRCKPECGQLIPSEGTDVVGGHDAIRGEFPWHIGLFRFNSAKFTHEYQCGGSIITPLHVITAAHCVTSESNVRFKPRDFYVTAGKYYSGYDVTQQRQVISYEIPEGYRANFSNYEADIAVLIVEKPFTLSNDVQPVCVDWNNYYEEEQLKPNQTGTVVGWDFTNPGKPKASDTLKQLTASYVDHLVCLDALPELFQRFVTQDKFCAGWTNGACKSDSGGGLVFKRSDNGGNKEKFYLRGLVSVGPLKNTQCDNYKYEVYTKISAHMKWIKEVVTSMIENYKICDGVVDCTDGSDESYPVCKDVLCPDYAFRCRYGACLDSVVKCNGQKDCADGSDEEPSMCITNKPKPTPTRPLADGSCALLNIINGDYSVLGSAHIKGNPIPNLSIVNITCKKGYGLYPSDSINTCISGVWNDLPLQECRYLCEPRISTSVEVACTLDGRDIDCTKPVVEGTVAESRCKRFYYQTHDDFPTSKCSGGSWDNPLIRCDPECGQLIPSEGTDVVGGHDAIRGEFPWHIGLYHFNSENDTYEYRCGGSIITPLLVITAAHCVTSKYNERFEPREFYVAAGKYYSDYDATDDSPGLVQKRQVQSYEIPREYRAYYSNYEGDIAVILIAKAFTLSNVVQPVCVDWNNIYEEQQLRPARLGNVVGWNIRDPGKPKASETLKQLTAPYIDRLDCLDATPQEFQRFVTQDKFCAGWTNGSSVCKGASGSGLVFKWIDNSARHKIRFYLRGLVSVGTLEEKQCPNYKFGVYTKISTHIQLIKRMVSENKVT